MSLYPNKNRELSSRSAANQYKFDSEMGNSARFIYLMVAGSTVIYIYSNNNFFMVLHIGLFATLK